ncbi:C-X-C motif chemokine 9 [Talpa occidentalis]|uniref:C-X-C motif chemokine 9 n=1 Tax=Talpa occidentalis TaxID=50954 RepID=UPI00188FB24E|nr:C-X-C motif chemokine 9 [Talpa occidentalis]
MKKSVVLLLLDIIFLILIGVQGTPIRRRGRCLCITTSNGGDIYLKSIKDINQYDPTPSCEKTEIIAIMKNGHQTCLNPDSKDAQNLIKRWKKQADFKKKQKEGRKYPKIKKGLNHKKSQHSQQKKTA